MFNYDLKVCRASVGFGVLSANWEQAFRTYGATPHQSPGHIRAEMNRIAAGQFIVLMAGGAISAFRVESGTARCLVEGAGIVPLEGQRFNPNEFLRVAIQQLGVDTIHMPLLYMDLDPARAFLEVHGGQWLERRPTPIISPPFDQQTFVSRCAARLGSRARRRMDRFAKAGLAFAGLEGEPAVRALDMIERRSWKATCGQDMHSRDQFVGYADRLRSGELKLTAVVAQEQPIAYRIDTVINGVVFVLKWSFDESWRRVSPGFSLLAVDLPKLCEAVGATQADLFGSPDLLKDALSTGERRRIEFVWPDGPKARAIIAERRAYDARAAQAHERGKGIRTSYQVSVEHRA